MDKTQQDDDQFVVLITTDSGTSWQILRQWNNTGSPYVYNDITCSAAGEPVAIDLSSFSGQKIAIALYGESTVTGNGDNNLHVGNLKIDYIPSCFKPLSLVADNFTTTSARLGWLPAGSETDWMIQYKKVGESVWTTIGANVNPFTLQNLEPATQYEVQMAAWCDTSDSTAVSEFTRPISFTTECDVISSFPWAEGFDSIAGTSSATSNNLPVCTSYDPQPQYAILPEMNGLDDKQLTLWAKGYSSSSAIKIGRMTNPADTSTFQLIAEQSLTTSYKEYTFNLSAATGNYVAIMIDAATPERSTNGAYVDDISIHEAPACAKPSALAVSEVTSHTAKLRWIAGFDETAWQIMLNGDAEHLIAADTNVFVLTNLPADSLIIEKEGAGPMNEYRGKHAPSKPWAVASTASVPVRRARHLQRSRRRRFWMIFSVIFFVFLLVYPLIEARILTTDKKNLRSEELPADANLLRIVYLSDIHWGFWFSDSDLNNLIVKINSLRPDLVLFGGDYATDHESAILFFRRLQELTTVHARYGIFGVPGETDRGEDNQDRTLLSEAMANAGVTPLINKVEKVQIGSGSVCIAGLDDALAGKPDLKTVSSQVSARDYVILLCHNPSIIADAQQTRNADGDLNWFDLGLFGHTHGGQMQFFSGLLGIADDVSDRYLSGWFTENRVDLLVSHGVGTSVFPARLFCPPQIHLIEVTAY